MYTPSPPILQAAHPESRHWYWRCYAAARWHPDGSVREACQRLLLWMAARRPASQRRQDSRRRYDSQDPVPFSGWLRCICLVVDDKIWRPVEAGHGFACDIFIQNFYTLKFSGKCLLCCNLGHVGVMESMVADGMTFF